MTRTFEDTEATRGNIPLLFGIFGPSSSGKTYSALRIASGIQRVSGGDIHVIDTESLRAKHYADKFRFRHVDFRAPFCPLDYLAAIEHCVKRGAKTVIVDSMSHEHEGQGGVLEQHDAECERLQKAWRGASIDKVNFPAWSKPKAKRRRLINSILQMNINLILCFRAKEKVVMVGGKPTNVGWMPVGAEDYMYECTARALLLPGARGVPTWFPDENGSKSVANLPDQFRAIFDGKSGPLDESAGEAMAKWAAGTPSKPTTTSQAFTELSSAIESTLSEQELKALVPRLSDAKGQVSPDEHNKLRSLYGSRQKALASAQDTTQDDGYREDFE